MSFTKTLLKAISNTESETSISNGNVNNSTSNQSNLNNISTPNSNRSSLILLSLNEYIVDEKIQKVKNIEQDTLDNLKENIDKYLAFKNAEAPKINDIILSATSTLSTLNSSNLLNFNTISLNSPLPSPLPLPISPCMSPNNNKRRSSNLRRCIGDKDFKFLISLVKFTELELKILVSLFGLKQRKGLIDCSVFSEIIQYFHGYKELSSNTFAVELLLSSQQNFVNTPKMIVTQSNLFFPESNIKPNSPYTSKTNKSGYFSLNDDLVKSRSHITSFGLHNKNASTKNVSDLTNAVYLERINSCAINSESTINNDEEDDDPPAPIVFKEEDSLQPVERSEFLEAMNENSSFAKRVFEIFEFLKFGEMNYLEFALSIALLCDKSIYVQLSCFLFELLDFNATDLISKSRCLEFLKPFPKTYHSFTIAFEELNKDNMNFKEFEKFFFDDYFPHLSLFFKLPFERMINKLQAL